MILKKYKTMIFDCDGVILNTNKIKSEAFYKVALQFGNDSAQLLLDYHLNNGGVSRYEKFRWLLSKLNIRSIEFDYYLNQMLISYSDIISEKLLSSEVAVGLQELRQMTREKKWLIVSGGDESELNSIFRKKSLHVLFDGGIFGSPVSKMQIIEREITNGNIDAESIFIGDSKYDYIVAEHFKIDFIFATAWSEFEGWDGYFNNKNVRVIESIKNLLDEN